MQYTKIHFFGAVVAVGLLVNGCSSSSVTHANDYVYNGINFGPDRNANFKQGVRDACKTADGDYTKDHVLFRNDVSYRVGWEDGRIQCKGKGDEVVQ